MDYTTDHEHMEGGGDFWPNDRSHGDGHDDSLGYIEDDDYYEEGYYEEGEELDEDMPMDDLSGALPDSFPGSVTTHNTFSSPFTLPFHTRTQGAAEPPPGLQPQQGAQARQAQQAQRIQLPSLFKAGDPQLLNYLKQRGISPLFLSDVDRFIEDNKKLFDMVPGWLRTFAMMPPLQGYLFFVQGCTRPAHLREHQAVKVDEDYDTKQSWLNGILPLHGTHDQELHAFFYFQKWRYDSLHLVDAEIRRIGTRYLNSEALSHEELRLLTYAIFGNAIDTYKYFQFTYQKAWLEDAFAPAHTIFQRLPFHGANTHLPLPLPASSLALPSHATTRHLLSRALAWPYGYLDLTSALLSEFSRVVSARGFRHHETQHLLARASRRIHKFKGWGAAQQASEDVVEIVMGLAVEAERPWERRQRMDRLRSAAFLARLACERDEGEGVMVARIRAERDYALEGAKQVREWGRWQGMKWVELKALEKRFKGDEGELVRREREEGWVDVFAAVDRVGRGCWMD